MRVGKKIRKLRKEAHLRQGELAALAGMPQSTLSDIENGRTEVPGGQALVKLAAALKVSPEILVATGEETMPTTQHVTTEESELLEIYKALADSNRQVLMAAARAMREAQPEEIATRGSFNIARRLPDA